MWDEAKLMAALEKARQVLQDALNELLDDDWDQLAHDVSDLVVGIEDVINGDVEYLPESAMDLIDASQKATRLQVTKAEVN